MYRIYLALSLLFFFFFFLQCNAGGCLATRLVAFCGPRAASPVPRESRLHVQCLGAETSGHSPFVVGSSHVLPRPWCFLSLAACRFAVWSLVVVFLVARGLVTPRPALLCAGRRGVRFCAACLPCSPCSLWLLLLRCSQPGLFGLFLPLLLRRSKERELPRAQGEGARQYRDLRAVKDGRRRQKKE